MRFWTHMSVGLAAALYIVPKISGGYMALAAFGLGTLFPDIDSTKSLLGSRFRVIGWVFRHRGLFHSLLVLAALALAAYASLGSAVALSFALGFLTHLALDALTKEGITPFFPFELRLSGSFRTGGLFDYLLFFSGALACGIIYLNA